MQSRIAPLACVPVLFFAGAIASRTLLQHVPATYAIDLAQPVPVATWWGMTGALQLAVLFLVLALAFVPYAVVLRDPPPLRTTLVAAALSLIVALFWLPLFSSDVYAYAAYGELARGGFNPYAHAIGGGPLVAAAQWQWSGGLPVCVYGAGFVAVASVVVTLLQHFGAAAQLDAFRVLASVAFLFSIALLKDRRAAFFVALNPIALWTVSEGHNDALALAVVLAGIALYRRQRNVGAFVATLAGAIKIPAVVTGFALSFGGAVAGALVVALSSIPLALATIHDVAPHGHYAPFASVQSLHPLLAIALAALPLSRIRNAATRIDAFAYLGLAAWLAIPNPYPWYALWLLPLAAFATDRRIALTTLAISTAALLRYVPDAVATPGSAVALVLGIAALAAYAPLLRRAIIVRP